jgi:hypothetical protein
MRKRYRVLLIAAVVAALVVPVGYALSLESQPTPALIARAELSQAAAATIVASPVLTHQRVGAAAPDEAESPFHAVPDAGKLVLVGTILFGLSALVRKAI